MAVKHCPGSGTQSLNKHSVMAHCPKCAKAVGVRANGTLVNHNRQM